MPVTHNRDEVLDATIYARVLAGDFVSLSEVQTAYRRFNLSDAVAASVARLKKSELIDVDKSGRLVPK